MEGRNNNIAYLAKRATILVHWRAPFITWQMQE
jgi:hypothetical protein